LTSLTDLTHRVKLCHMPIDFDDEIRNMVCEAMIQHSVTQTDLAGKTGLSLPYLSRVLRGSQSCSTKRWSQIMNAVLGEDNSQPVVKPKPVQDKPIEQPTKPALTPHTKPPFIRPLVPPKLTVPVYGDPNSDHYQPPWDDNETAS